MVGVEGNFGNEGHYVFLVVSLWVITQALFPYRHRILKRTVLSHILAFALDFFWFCFLFLFFDSVWALFYLQEQYICISCFGFIILWAVTVHIEMFSVGTYVRTLGTLNGSNRKKTQTEASL